MRIGVPREIKDHEFRVGLTPAGARALAAAGHEVRVQSAAGERIGLPDQAYRDAGATVVPDAAAVYGADLVVKVKEPQPAELPLLRDGQALFCYLHLAAAPAVARALLDRGSPASRTRPSCRRRAARRCSRRCPRSPGGSRSRRACRRSRCATAVAGCCCRGAGCGAGRGGGDRGRHRRRERGPDRDRHRRPRNAARSQGRASQGVRRSLSGTARNASRECGEHRRVRVARRPRGRRRATCMASVPRA